MNQSLADLPYRFLDQLKALSFVEAIYLYGSRARGDGDTRSDIDLAILCPEASRKDWLEVLEIIETADTLLFIDCVRFDRLEEDDPLKQMIAKDKIVLYRKDTPRGS